MNEDTNQSRAEKIVFELVNPPMAYAENPRPKYAIIAQALDAAEKRGEEQGRLRLEHAVSLAIEHLAEIQAKLDKAEAELAELRAFIASKCRCFLNSEPCEGCRVLQKVGKET